MKKKDQNGCIILINTYIQSHLTQCGSFIELQQFISYFLTIELFAILISD